MSYAGPVASRGRPSAAQPGSVRPVAVAGPYKAGVLRRQRQTSGVVFAAGVFLGLAVGAGVALLFAPKAGSDTRRAIGRRGKRLAHRGRDAWDDLRYELKRAARRRKLTRAPSDDERQAPCT